MMIDEQLLNEILNATNEARFLDAYNLAITLGPFEKLTGEAKLLAGRLAGHICSRELCWSLTSQAWREHPKRTKFLMQRIYALSERRGILAAWYESKKLTHSESLDNEERADGLVCQAVCSLFFRDFESAKGLFARAKELHPNSPWVISESSSLFSQAGDHQEALKIIEQALDLKSDSRAALHRKAEYLLKLQKTDEAIEVLEFARTKLQSTAIVGQLVEIYNEKENWDYLLELIEEAERLAPLADKNCRSWFAAMRINSYLGLGRFSEARQEALKIEKNTFYQRLAERLEVRTSPNRRVKIEVPFVQQNYNTCAPATLSAVTSFFGKPIPQETLIGEICYDGTFDYVERRWADRNGWFTREFKVTWDSALTLLEKGIPFVLTTSEISSGHSQAVIGYDEIRATLLIRDPSSSSYNEMSYEDFQKHYSPVGPRGFLLIPEDRAGEVRDLNLEDSTLFDFYYALNCSLDEYDRSKALGHLSELEKSAPEHRLTWMGKRAIASYDQNPLTQLEAVEGLLSLYPEDDRLIFLKIQMLRTLGNSVEASRALHDRCRKPKVPPIFWKDYALEKGVEKGSQLMAFRLNWRSVKWDSYNVDSLIAFSLFLWNREQRTEALEIQRIAVLVGEKREYVVDTYFQMLQAVGMTDEGLSFLRKRSDENLKRSADPAITLINVLERLNRSAEAKQVLDNAIHERPNDGSVQLRYARFEADSGHPDRSREFLEQAHQNTNPLPWLRTAAELEQLQGGFDGALSHFQNILELSPLDNDAHSRVAWLLARKLGKAEAQAYVRKLGKKFPFHRAILHLELEWIKTDFPEEAETRLRTYLAANRNDAWAHRELAIYLNLRSVPDEALVEALKGKELEPFHPASYQVESLTLQSLGRDEEAKTSLRRVLEIDINCDFAMRRLIASATTLSEKLESIAFIREQLRNQHQIGPAIDVFREVAFPILDGPELSAEIKGLWKERPELIESWISWTKQLTAAGRVHEAKNVAVEGTNRFPLVPLIWNNAAFAFRRLNDFSEAKRCLLEALKINPDLISSLTALAEIYRRDNHLDEALQLLTRANQRNPLSSVLLGTKAEILWQQGAYEEALTAVQNSVEVSPDYNWGWNALHQWSVLLKRESPALDLAKERAVRLKNDAQAWLQVCHLANLAGKPAERLDAAIKARECEPRNVDAHDAAILALVTLGRYEEAFECSRTKIFGDHIPLILRGREAWLYSTQDKLDIAVEKMRLVVSNDPYYLWGWEQLANWHMTMKRFKDALDDIEMVVRLSPLNDSAYTTRAQIYEELDRSTDAESDYQKVIAINPANVFAGWQLFQLQIKRGDIKSAQNTIDLTRGSVQNGITLALSAILSVRQQAWSEANSLLTKLSLEPQADGGIFYAVLKAFDDEGEKKKVDKILDASVRDANCNKTAAILWADRNGISISHKFGLLKRMPKESDALQAVLLHLIRREEKGGRGKLILKLLNKAVSTFRYACSTNPELWGDIGRLYYSRLENKKALNWYHDWESRNGVKGFMVTNYVFALHAAGRTEEADVVSKKIFEGGLADHTAYLHHLYLALSAIEHGEGREARSHFQAANGGVNSDSDKYFRTVVEQTLLVHEAISGNERNEAAARARYKISQSPNPGPGARWLRLEKRVRYQIARDARDAASRWDAAKAFFRIPKLRLRFSGFKKPYVFFYVFIILTVTRFITDSQEHKNTAAQASAPANPYLPPKSISAAPHSGSSSVSPQQQSLLIGSDPSSTGNQATPVTDPITGLKQSAEHGDVTAQYQLGVAYLYGRDVQKDPSEALKWLLKAANQGNANAQAGIADIFIGGIGVPKSSEEAVSWWRKAADQGNAGAECNLAVALWHGDGVVKNQAEAIKWFHKSADQGFEKAQRALKEIGPEGEAIVVNPVQWVNGVRQMADQGDAEAKWKLGMAYEQGVGVIRDPNESIKWFRDSAEQGFAKAQNALGNCYWKASGADKDPAQALIWYQKAAAQGEPFAECNLGFFYENGIAVPKDLTEAMRWYRLAADQGNKVGISGVKRLTPQTSP